MTFSVLKVAAAPPDTKHEFGVRLLRELLDVLEEVGLAVELVDVDGPVPWAPWVCVMSGATAADGKRARETKQLVDARRAGLIDVVQRGVELWARLGPTHPMILEASTTVTLEPPAPAPVPDVDPAPAPAPAPAAAGVSDELADFLAAWAAYSDLGDVDRTRKVAAVLDVKVNAVIRWRNEARERELIP